VPRIICNGHHRLLHDGHLTINGRAPDELRIERNGAPLRGREGHVLPKHSSAPSVKKAMKRPSLNEDDPVVLAQAALRQMGFKASLAASAVDEACAHVGATVDLAALIKEALRHCG
jgi:hypothetical protein